MSRYTAAEEERLQAVWRAREWMRSGLLDAQQLTSIEAGLRTDLKRTNSGLSFVLAVFGTIVTWAALGFVLVLFHVSDNHVIARSAIAAGVVCFLLAEFLVFRFRLYRFGVEEALSVWAVVLVAGGTGILVQLDANRGELPTLVGLLTAMIVSFAVYLRFGYFYAAFLSAGCAALAPFFMGQSMPAERVLSAAVLIAVFLAARSLRRPYGEDYPGNDYGAIEAAAWLGLYVVLNLQLSSDTYLFSEFRRSGAGRLAFTPAFYWATYAATWVLPAAGLYLGLRGKHRWLIRVNLILVVATLATNKLYLGWPRHTWDPILLGVFLSITSIAVRRWLRSGAGGERLGFTPERILSSDRRSLAKLVAIGGMVQPIDAHFHTGPAAAPAPPAFEPGGGGQSGGGGGGGAF